MTLEEAIEHAEKVAEENEKISLYTPVEFIPADVPIEQCQKCADDHRQLAAWLRELKERRRRQPEIIHCGECAFPYIRGKNMYCDHITGEEIMVWKDEYCSWAERRTDGDQS